MIKMRLQKTGQVLPRDASDVLLHNYLMKNIGQLQGHIKALRLKGWTLESIGQELSLTRERVRQLESQVHITQLQRVLDAPSEFPLPDPPVVTWEVPDVHVPLVPSAEAVERLLELQPLAQKVRANSPNYRAEAEEYTALLYKVMTEENITVYQMAIALGVTRHAIESRLVRYGYKASPGGTMKDYRPIKQENRVQV